MWAPLDRVGLLFQPSPGGNLKCVGSFQPGPGNIQTDAGHVTLTSGFLCRIDFQPSPGRDLLPNLAGSTSALDQSSKCSKQYRGDKHLNGRSPTLRTLNCDKRYRKLQDAIRDIAYS